MIQTAHHLAIQPFVFCPIVSAPKMAPPSPAISHRKMCHKWSQSHSTMPSTTTILNSTKKCSTGNVKIQMVVTSKPPSSSATSTPTIQLSRKHTEKDTKLPFTPSRKFNKTAWKTPNKFESLINYCFYFLATTMMNVSGPTPPLMTGLKRWLAWGSSLRNTPI